jgi:hypothetical protein
VTANEQGALRKNAPGDVELAGAIRRFVDKQPFNR